MKPKKSRGKYNYDQLSPVEVYQLILAGKIKKFPKGTWEQPDSVEYAADIVRYWIEHILKWSDEDIKKGLSARLFIKHKLGGPLQRVFGESPYQAINAVYPGRFKEWDLPIVPQNYWDYENAIAAIKWLIEEKLQWNDEDIKKNLTSDVFKKNRLARPFGKLFHSRPFQVLEAVYPGRFKEWELSSVSLGFWTHENAAKAVKWLIEEKLQWSEEDIKQQFSQKVFINNGLHGLLQEFFKSSPFKALDSTYPGRFNEWELLKVPYNFWTKENTVKAIKWLIEEKLKWPDEEIKRKMSGKVFEKYGLDHPLRKLFKRDVFEALNAAYPGRFTRQDLLQLRKPKIAYRAFPEVSPKI
jgi:hypothetical protein